MPGPTLLMHAASWSQALPPTALTGVKGWHLAGRRWAALANLLYLISDAVGFLLSQRGVNNLWLGYLATPVGSIFTLLALSSWQPTARSVRIVRLMIPIYLLIWVSLSFLEDIRSHPILVMPAHSLLVLVVCLTTLARNALWDRPVPIWKSDWFWISTGMALAVGASSTTGPLLRQLLADGKNALAFTVVEVRAGFNLAAVILMTIGMLCPVPPAPSGRSSSPAP